MYNTIISKSILIWYKKNKRDLPWRKSTDPYKIWLSEIMLQQTQVSTVIPYYNNWIEKYPTINSISNASLDCLLKLWEGLGYYSRCRNFYKSCQIINNKFDGSIPHDQLTFRSFPGVGAYTAGAVLSIAFNKKIPAIDGNINRVACRLLGIKNLTQINKKRIYNKILAMVQVDIPGDLNQALMDIGSLICKPRDPKCSICPIKQACKAFLSGKPSIYPSKPVTKVLQTKIFVAGYFIHRNRILIIKRPTNGLLGGLWELPTVEVPSIIEELSALEYVFFESLGLQVNFLKKIGMVNHAFSHYKMNIYLYECINDKNKKKIKNGKWVKIKNFKQYSFSKANHKLFNLLK